MRIPVPARLANVAFQAGVDQFGGVGDFQAAIADRAQTQRDGAGRIAVRSELDTKRVVELIGRNDDVVARQIERIRRQLLMRHHLVVQQFRVGFDTIVELVVAQRESAGALIRDQVVVTDRLEVEAVGTGVAAEIGGLRRRGSARQLVARQGHGCTAQLRSDRRTSWQEETAARRTRRSALLDMIVIQILRVRRNLSIRRGDRILLVVLHAEQDVALVAGLTEQHVDRAAFAVVLVGLAVVGTEFGTLIIRARDDVDHARDCVGTVHSRSAIVQHSIRSTADTGSRFKSCNWNGIRWPLIRSSVRLEPRPRSETPAVPAPPLLTCGFIAAPAIDGNC